MNQEQNNFNIQENSANTNNQNINSGVIANQQQQPVNQMNMNGQPFQSVNTYGGMNLNNKNINPGIDANQPPLKPKKNTLLKILTIIGGIVVGVFVFAVVIISIVSANSEKLVCKSSKGNITIMYDDKSITGYTANGVSYDLDGQKEYAKEIGIDAYIKEFSNWFKNNTNGTCTIDGKEVLSDNEEFKDEDIQKNKRVGSDEFGYITIPENWTKFIDVDGNSTLQYSYANVYIATLYAVPTTQIDAYNYASNILNKLESDGAQNVKGTTVNIGKYKAYQVYGYFLDQNVWMVCWFFEAEDGKTHYISIEGPDRNSEYFNIAESFSLNK